MQFQGKNVTWCVALIYFVFRRQIYLTMAPLTTRSIYQGRFIILQISISALHGLLLSFLGTLKGKSTKLHELQYGGRSAFMQQNTLVGRYGFSVRS